MAKAVLFLADGMADEPLEELNGKTPLEAVETPGMDSIAAKGASGTFLSLPDGFPTSSDAANMSVLGYNLAKFYPGRGPIEAVSQDIKLADDDIAWRCNLVSVKDGVLLDYSAGHIENSESARLFSDLQKNFGGDKITFYPGVSYRNLIVLHGKEFSSNIEYFKPDSSQGEKVAGLKLSPLDNSKEARHTVEFLEDVMEKANAFLAGHRSNRSKKHPANAIWPWSPGHRPALPAFSEKYAGKTGAVISAVDVIFGLAKCVKMEVIKVPGATGFIDTNYAGKAAAAVKALEKHDFVFLHVEAIDECGHIGDIKLKMQAIGDFDARIVVPVMQALKNRKDVTFAVLPDHPVPIKLRKHTRTPVPVAIYGPHIKSDLNMAYSEKLAVRGKLGAMRGDQLMRRILNLPENDD